MASQLPAPCLACGQIAQLLGAGYCDSCRPLRSANAGEQDKANTSQRGYGTRWRRLSEKARRLQPWCERCGATRDLSLDHVDAETWARQGRGKQLRLGVDVHVLCRSCNSAKGQARQTPGKGSPSA